MDRPDLAGKSEDELAQMLYDSNANRVKPAWDQLGDGTKSVWRGYIQAGRLPPSANVKVHEDLGPIELRIEEGEDGGA